MGLPVWSADETSARGPKKLLLLLYQYLFELIALNVFFLLCCIPVVTIPFAVSALVKVLLSLCQGRGSHPLRAYWQTFFSFRRRVFAVGAPLEALELLLLWGLLIYLGASGGSPLFWLGCGVNAAALLLVILVKFYAFPLLHSTRDTPRRILLRAFCLALEKLPYSLAAFAAIAVIWILLVRNLQSAWILVFLLAFSLSYLIGTFCAAPWVGEPDGEGGA